MSKIVALALAAGVIAGTLTGCAVETDGDGGQAQSSDLVGALFTNLAVTGTVAGTPYKRTVLLHPLSEARTLSNYLAALALPANPSTFALTQVGNVTSGTLEIRGLSPQGAFATTVSLANPSAKAAYGNFLWALQLPTNASGLNMILQQAKGVATSLYSFPATATTLPFCSYQFIDNGANYACAVPFSKDTVTGAFAVAPATASCVVTADAPLVVKQTGLTFTVTNVSQVRGTGRVSTKCTFADGSTLTDAAYLLVAPVDMVVTNNTSPAVQDEFGTNFLYTRNHSTSTIKLSAAPYFSGNSVCSIDHLFGRVGTAARTTRIYVGGPSSTVTLPMVYDNAPYLNDLHEVKLHCSTPTGQSYDQQVGIEVSAQ